MAIQQTLIQKTFFHGILVAFDKCPKDLNDFLEQMRNITQKSWRIISKDKDERINPHKPYLLVCKGEDYISSQEGWNLYYALLDYLESYASFDDIEPYFSGFQAKETEPFTSSILDYDRFNTPETEGEYEWHLGEDQLDVRRAWKWSNDHGKASKGKGIKIGHPDSGYIIHDEYSPSHENILQGKDFVDDDDDPSIVIDFSSEGNPGGLHGLSTGSVIISRDEETTAPHVTGVAPEASLIPYRVTAPGRVLPAPVLLDTQMSYLSSAIERATSDGCKVISMSLGGLRDRLVSQAVKKAVEQGVIVLAAAGNNVMFVVYPASDRNVIAVAGSNVGRGNWELSSRGPAVDVAAPGAAIYRAVIEREGDQVIKGVKRSSGTSYSVALTAGVAALWLAHHGHSNLVEMYGAHNICEVFRFLIKETVSLDEKSKWLRETKGYGAGIINAHQLLQKALPSPAALKKLGIVLSKEQWDEEQKKISEAFDSDPLVSSLGVDTTADDAIRISKGFVKSLGVYLGFLGSDLLKFTKKYAKEILHKFRLDGYLPLSSPSTVSTFADLGELSDEEIRETLRENKDLQESFHYFRAYLLECNLSDELKNCVQREEAVTSLAY